MVNFISTPPKPIAPEDIPEHQKSISSITKAILQEAGDFIDHAGEMEGQTPRVPIFFVKAYNFLKAEANEINYTDKLLDFLPESIKMTLLTEIGPSPPGTLYEVGENGLLVEPKVFSLHLEIVQLIFDVTAYLYNSIAITGRLPELPHSFILTFLYLRQRLGKTENLTEDDILFVNETPNMLQEQLLKNIGPQLIPEDYVKKGMETQTGRK